LSPGSVALEVSAVEIIAELLLKTVRLTDRRRLSRSAAGLE
jgi:hypothetical protein